MVRRLVLRLRPRWGAEVIIDDKAKEKREPRINLSQSRNLKEEPFASHTLIRSQKRVDVIQVIRCIAALSVLFFHCKIQLNDDDSLRGTIDWLFNSGAAGVDVFFVVSGFIMVYSTNGKYDLSKRSNSVRFFYKRLLRVWPPYLVITLLLLGLQYLFKRYNPYISTEYILKSLFFVPIELSDPPFYGYPLLAVGWSLTYEVYFYLIFAISFLFKSYRYIFLIAYSAFTICVIPLISTGQIDLSAHQPIAFGTLGMSFITNPMMLEFLIGVAIGLAYLNKTFLVFIRRVFPTWLAYSILLLVAWQFLSGFWGGHGITDWGIGASLLVFVSVFYFDRMKFPGPLIKLGEWSYSLYLIHLPVLFFLTKIFENNNLPSFTKGQSALFLVAGFSIIAAYLSYQVLEVRLTKFISKHITFS